MFLKVSVIFLIFSISNGLKILGVLSFGSHSHFTLGNSILETLNEANHEITAISPYPRKTALKNFREISTADVLEQFKQEQLHNAFEFRIMGSIGLMKFIHSMGDVTVKTYLSHPNVRKLLNSNETFDICIFENFNTEAMMGMIENFNCTLITYTTFATVTWIDEMTGNQSPASYVPHPFLDYSDKMTFFQRLYNTFTFYVEKFLYHFHHLPNQRKLFEKYFPNAKRPLDKILKSSSIIFMNNHVSASTPQPYLPNMIEIGGIHVRPAKPLPDNIKQYLDSATDGAILFSMGSIIQASKWSTQQREAFIGAFSKIKQKVLWKYEVETMPNKPDNVAIMPWIPQRDILAHPNVKLFISHGGKLGTTEALYEGVPILGVPVYGDQMMNMAKLKHFGSSLQILYENITEEAIFEALKEMLDNQKYYKNAKDLANRFKDRPMTPQQSVVFWTEFAARHKNFSYVSAVAKDLSYIELHLIDVHFVIFLIILGVIFIILMCLKIILSKIIKSSSLIVDGQQNKKTQ